MAITRCPSCRQRMSSLADSCPACGFGKTAATAVEPEVHLRRQLRTRRYQARMSTYCAMLITMVGFLMWWFQNSGFNQLPSKTSSLLIAVGLVSYFAARGWLFWINKQLKAL